MPSQLVSVRMVHLYLSPSPFTLNPNPSYPFMSKAGVKFLVRTCTSQSRPVNQQYDGLRVGAGRQGGLGADPPSPKAAPDKPSQQCPSFRLMLKASLYSHVTSFRQARKHPRLVGKGQGALFALLYVDQCYMSTCIQGQHVPLNKHTWQLKHGQ